MRSSHFDHGKDGWLVSPDNVRALTLSMAQMLRNKARRSALARNARLKAETQFKRSTIHSKLFACFDTALNVKGNGHGNEKAGIC